MPELSAGVVKTTAAYPKNTTQHAADLRMLGNCESMPRAFINPATKTPKQIECIRVDGASDKGSSH